VGALPAFVVFDTLYLYW